MKTIDTHFQRLLHDSLFVSAERHPEKVAVIVEGTPYTYRNLLEESIQLAALLQTAGIRRGDRVAIHMDNTWPCVVSIFGTLMTGGVFVIVNPQTKSDKLRHILVDCEARALITDGHLSRVFLPILGETPSIQRVICSGNQPGPISLPIEIVPFDQIYTNTESFADPEVISNDLAALIYTSGSTGNPKGVMMTHQAMSFTAGSLVEYLRLNEQDRIMNVLPLAFDYGLYQLLMTVRLGATLLLERSFAYPAQTLDRIRKESSTVFPGVPTIFMTLLSIHSRTPISFPSVKRVTNTAAALPADIVPRLRQIFPNALIFRMYGLTECKRVCYLEPELIDKKPDSVGRAIPGTETFLLSEEGGPVAPGEVGILHVRGPHVMLGYWNQPELSAEMLKPGRLPGERILCTHDFFKMDEDGYLYFVGRSDDIIKTRGEKVSPIEVENCLHGLPGVREAAVLGIPDELLGEAIRAYVALDQGAVWTETEIKSYCLSKLENFMVPKEIVFLSELPKTPTGKIRRKGLREDAHRQ